MATANQAALNLLDRTANEIERFVYFKHKELYKFVALWVIGTHLKNEFDYFGYLLITSPQMECGKTRFLDVLNLLCWKSSGILIDPTQAVTFHTADNNTQLMDEIDTWREGTDLRSVLNAGFQKGLVVQRMSGDTWDELKQFPVYGPKVLAGINAQRILNPTTCSRTFEIEMTRQLPGERRERFTDKGRESLKVIHAEIAAWTLTHAACVRDIYQTSEPSYLEPFSDRSRDIIRPLASIIESIKNANVRDLLAAIPIVRKEEPNVNQDIDVFVELAKHLNGEPLKASAEELAELTGLKAHPISHALRQYGFSTKTERCGSEPRKRYTLTHEAIQDVVARFG